MSDFKESPEKFAGFASLEEALLNCSEAEINEVIEQEMKALDELPQNTEHEVCLVRHSDGNEEVKMAQDMGNPLPQAKLLQRDFLQVEERKDHLERLREAGDLKALAQYEHDCLSAVLVTDFGYKTNYQSSPTDVSELLTSNQRNCGTTFMQTAHWIKRMKHLNVKGCVAEETSLGQGSHYFFVAIDALGDAYLFDPAFKRPLVHVGRDTDICRDRLDLDEKSAYERNIHPHFLIRDIDSLLYSLFLRNAFCNSQNAAAKVNLIKKRSQVLNVPATIDEVYFLYDNGNDSSAVEKACQLVEYMPNDLDVLECAATILFDSGNFSMGMQMLSKFLYKNTVVISNLKHAISHRSQTDCAVSGKIGPVCIRYETILERLISYNKIITGVLRVRARYRKMSNVDICIEHLKTLGDFFLDCYNEILSAQMEFLRERGKYIDEENLQQTREKGLALFREYQLIA